MSGQRWVPYFRPWLAAWQIALTLIAAWEFGFFAALLVMLACVEVKFRD